MPVPMSALDPYVQGLLGGGQDLTFGMGEKIYCVESGGAALDFLKYKRPSKNVEITLPNAYARAVTGRNDTIILSPDSHSLGATFTHAKNMVHLIGGYGPAHFNQRSRIGMSTTFTPMITVSGYGNTFANIYTMHGTAATDLVGWYITGHRNSFVHCHFGGPMNADQGGHASYIGLHQTGTECYYENCTFGTSSIGRDEHSPNVKLGPGSTTVFRGCLFHCMLTDGDPYFVQLDNTGSVTQAWFIDCIFTAMASNWAVAMAEAINFTSSSTAGCYFNNGCQFINVTALTAAATDQWIFLPRQFVTTTDTEGMISPVLTI